MESDIKIKVAETLDDLMKVMVIRGAVFIGEQQHRYSTEFGDNELLRMHLLATVDNEPAGTMRIITDGDSAKFERLAVLSPYRKTAVGEKIRLAGNDICREKGIRKVYGLCKPGILHHWEQHGYQRIGDKILKVDDMVLIPIVLNLRPELRGLNAKELSEIPDILMHQPGGVWLDGNSNAIAVIMKNKRNYQSGQ